MFRYLNQDKGRVFDRNLKNLWIDGLIWWPSNLNPIDGLTFLMKANNYVCTFLLL